MEGLIHGGAYFRNFTVFDERYIIRHIIQRKAMSGGLSMCGQRTGARFRLTSIRVKSY